MARAVKLRRIGNQELSVLCLHLLQSCLVYINTLMLQDILAEPEWMRRIPSGITLPENIQNACAGIL
jgi:TnpA family transposase